MPREAISQTDANAPIDVLADGVDFGGVTTGFEPHPEGLYDAVVESSEVRTSQAGNPYLNVTFDLVSASGKQWASFPLIANSLWRLKAALVALGVKPAMEGKKMTVDEIQQEIRNLPCTLKLVIENYKPKGWTEGQELSRRNQVKDVLPAGAAKTMKQASRAF